MIKAIRIIISRLISSTISTITITNNNNKKKKENKKKEKNQEKGKKEIRHVFLSKLIILKGRKESMQMITSVSTNVRSSLISQPIIEQISGNVSGTDFGDTRNQCNIDIYWVTEGLAQLKWKLESWSLSL